MSIFDGVQKSEAQMRYESIMEKAPLLKQGEENRCLSAFTDFWGGGDFIEVEIGGIMRRVPQNPISREVATELLELLGTNATAVFLHHQAWQTFIKSVNPSWVPLTPPYALTFAEDGSVTLTPE
jgi:truncated hemoglobin YjbI